MAGIFAVDSNGNFNSKEKMTRGDMAKALAIAFGLDIPNQVSTSSFKDVSVNNFVNNLSFSFIFV